jgi:ATPase subunit of ABC transporter with duplicated ATPase domains
MAGNQSAILKVRNLSVAYEDEVIIRDLSFSVVEGSVFVILGPNGAGKTTLLRALLGLIPYQGTVTWQTRNISYLPPQEFLQRQELPPLDLAQCGLPDLYRIDRRAGRAHRGRLDDRGAARHPGLHGEEHQPESGAVCRHQRRCRRPFRHARHSWLRCD